MIKFSKDKILLLHRILAEATGGSAGVRDEALLDSSIESAYTTGFFTAHNAHDILASKIRAVPGKDIDMIIARSALSLHEYNGFRQSGFRYSDRLFARSYKANRDHAGIV